MTHGGDLSERLDIREKGAPKDGAPQASDRRLFMQLLVFGKCLSAEPLKNALLESGIEAVLYEDLNDPQGIALLLMNEDPGFFVRRARELLSRDPFVSLELRRDMTMTGRTYSLGREADLEDWLLAKPRRVVMNPAWPWCIWYPLRRKPEFELMPREEQGKILYEHARIGLAYGREDFAHDVRLACHGLDRNDNEFVIGLVGKELYPLSRVVQEMRKTQQTALYIQSLGPFFAGRVYWQSSPSGGARG